MKAISFTALHYGKSYLDAALRSVRDQVDECWIAYTPIGSHGHRTDIPCPETRDELYAIAQQAAGDKLRWYEGVWPYEGAQRDSIFTMCPDADVVVVVDSDEIYPNFDRSGLEYACANIPERNIRWPMIHFWRSFRHAVINDPAYPIRVVLPKNAAGEWTILAVPIAHMGYAQPEVITRYKIETHGHRAEWRADWYDTKFLPNAQEDVHPTNINYWNPVAVNPLDYLPEWMQEHPYWNREVIR